MKLTGDGFVLLILGQAMVFLFLGLMVLFINCSAAFVKRFLPSEEVEVFAETPDAAAEEAFDEAPAIAAAVIAVHQLRSTPA